MFGSFLVDIRTTLLALSWRVADIPPSISGNLVFVVAIGGHFDFVLVIVREIAEELQGLSNVQK